MIPPIRNIYYNNASMRTRVCFLGSNSPKQESSSRCNVQIIQSCPENFRRFLALSKNLIDLVWHCMTSRIGKRMKVWHLLSFVPLKPWALKWTTVGHAFTCIYYIDQHRYTLKCADQSISEVIEFEGYKFSRLGRFVSLLVPVNTLVLVSLFAPWQSLYIPNTKQQALGWLLESSNGVITMSTKFVSYCDRLSACLHVSQCFRQCCCNPQARCEL